MLLRDHKDTTKNLYRQIFNPFFSHFLHSCVKMQKNMNKWYKLLEVQETKGIPFQ